MSLLITNGRIITASDDYVADVYCHDGVITAIGPGLPAHRFQAGITTFKLFMAYPGVFMVDDATIFRALRRTGENGGLVCMHAENGGVIDVLVQEALRRGQKAPKYHALTRPSRAEAEATGRAIAL